MEQLRLDLGAEGEAEPALALAPGLQEELVALMASALVAVLRAAGEERDEESSSQPQDHAGAL